ncbi:unnamed protein product [Linum tenue]|uniref:Uncharacterized protein n=1 Tax=Linum tenue TaxID=586396 RepID=A0AAV0JR52_9ROSI|nr:unnamed protein product [Linum tenue]
MGESSCMEEMEMERGEKIINQYSPLFFLKVQRWRPKSRTWQRRKGKSRRVSPLLL